MPRPGMQMLLHELAHQQFNAAVLMIHQAPWVYVRRALSKFMEQSTNLVVPADCLGTLQVICNPPGPHD